MEPETLHTSIAGLTARYRDGSLLPSRHMADTLDLLERWEPRIGAFVTVAGERALSEARSADRLIAERGPAAWQGRPLLGMPVSVKDLTATEGIRTTRGSLAHRDHVPGRDAPAVARLRAAGAIVIGKTNTTEGGWSAAGSNRLQGPTRNPWDPALTSGGSSAGAAASIAAGVGVAATGTDGAGSIRIPAAFCGVVGFKPTRGRVPYVPHSPEGLSHLGPLTRTVADAALMVDVMSGYDPRDPLSHRVPAEPLAQDLAAFADRLPPLRIGWITSLGAPAPEPRSARTVRRALAGLEDRGHRVEEIEAPFEDPYPCLETILAAWEAAGHDPGPSDTLVDPGRLRVIEYGLTLGAAQLARAYEQRSRLRTQALALMERYDLLAMPTVAVAPFPAELHAPATRLDKGRLNWLAWAPEAYVFNLTGQPAVSIPAGLSEAGLPLGLQLVGALDADRRVLAAAHHCEQTNPWHHWYAELAKRCQEEDER
ncbi:amidase [Streptomyces sp. NPDC006530]|uniref:amidase n=1 Tax=Streptomyces sp. NPDC006530 TaxID=3364750 RepID=UPI0036A03EBF